MRSSHLIVYVLYGEIRDNYHHQLQLTLSTLTQFENVHPLVICDHSSAIFLEQCNFNNLIILENVQMHFRFSQINPVLQGKNYSTVSFRDADSVFTEIDVELLDAFSKYQESGILAIRDSRYHVWPLMGGLTTMNMSAFKKLEVFLKKYTFEENWYADQICLSDFYEKFSDELLIYHWGRGVRYTKERRLITSKKDRTRLIRDYPGFWGMPVEKELEGGYDFSLFPVPRWFTKKRRFLHLLELNLMFNKVRRRLHLN